MPRHVQTRTQSEPTAVGVVTAHMAVANTGAQGAYFVAYNDLPVTPNPLPTDEVLDGACNGAMSRVGGREISRESITFAGQPARSLTFEGNRGGQNFRPQTRVVLAGRRMYQVMWLGSADNVPAKDIESFFDSFKITSVAEAPSTPAGLSGPRSAQAGGSQSPSATQPSEAKRQFIYREVQTFRRGLEALTKQRDRLSEQGGNTSSLDSQIERMENSEESRLEQIAQRNRISREQLDEIISEGDDKGWGGRR
jgi:hypothetical protein